MKGAFKVDSSKTNSFKLEKKYVNTELFNVNTKELNSIEHYLRDLQYEFDTALSESPNSYKLEIIKLKYKNLYEFILKKIDECSLYESTNKIEKFISKVKLVGLKNQLGKVRNAQELLNSNKSLSGNEVVFSKLKFYKNKAGIKLKVIKNAISNGFLLSDYKIDSKYRIK